MLDAAARCFLAGLRRDDDEGHRRGGRGPVQTVFGQGSKAALLLACVDRALVGDDEAVPLAQREPFVALVPAAGPRQRSSRRLGRWPLRYVPRTVPMLRVFADAAAGDPEIAAAWAEYEQPAAPDSGSLIVPFAPLAARGPRPTGPTEIFWGLFSHAPAGCLVDRRGWTVEAYADFLVDAVAATAAGLRPVIDEATPGR